MATLKILLPYNFTPNDQKALDFVTSAFVHQKDAEITLFNSYTPAPEIEMRGSPIMDRMKGNLGYLSLQIKEHEDELEAAKGKLLQNGFMENQIQTVFGPRKKDIATDIVEFASTGGFNVVVLNRRHSKISRFFTGSVFQKVVTSLKETAVCIVS